MRTKVSEPTNGSVMILKARPANGSSSEQRRTTGSSRAHLDALDRRDVDRRRQIIDDRVEQRLHALVLEGRAAQHRHEACRRSCPCGCSASASPRRALRRRDRLRARRRPARPPARPAWRDSVCASSSRSAGISTTSNSAPSVSSRHFSAFICDQIDDADKIGLDPDRQLQHDRRWRRAGRRSCSTQR